MIGNFTFKYSRTFECAKHKKYNPEVVRKLKLVFISYHYQSKLLHIPVAPTCLLAGGKQTFYVVI